MNIQNKQHYYLNSFEPPTTRIFLVVFSFAQRKKKGGIRMKKHLIIAGIICAASIPPVYAVTKCVKLTSSTTCTSPSGATGQSNWSATCGGIAIQGVAFCGSKNGGATGVQFGSVPVSSTPDDNRHCWCKMVSPAVSSWVFLISVASAGACAISCANSCANAAQGSSAFRTPLFSGLSD